MSIKKPNLSSVVKSQLPEFVREDYETFIAFIEAYYEFLKLNYDIDLLKTRDIDDTLDEFIKYFKSEYAKDIPQTALNDRFLIPRIKDYYLAKGTEASFQILLALLFQKNVTIDYPSRQMLRASDGRWNQDVSLFAHINAGNPDMVVGRLIDVVTPTKVLRIQVNKTQTVEIEVDRIRQVVPGIYEFYIDRRFFGNVSIGDRLRYANIFDATILPTTAKIEIDRPGKGFKVGELYNINNGQGSGSILKVSRVNDTGGIIAAEFVKFGIGYTTDFTSTLIPNSTLTANTNAGATYLNIAGVSPNISVGLGETTDGFTESGIINRSDYVAQTPAEAAAEGAGLAWDGTYAGETVREFYNDSKQTVLDPDIPALIKINLGPLTKYPGYYTTNDGFLDDAIFIQDSRYYQAFSYVLKIDERLENYKSIVKTLLHPAGMALFGEYDIRNELDISEQLECMLKYLVLTFQDNLNIEDILEYKLFGKGLNDTISAPTDSSVNLIGKPLADNFTPSETINAKDFGKSVNSSYLNDGITLDDNTVTPTETINSKDFGKSLADNFTPSETINAKDFGKTVNSSLLYDGITLDNNNVTPTESAALLTSKPLSDTVDTPSDLEVMLFGKTVNSSLLYDGVTLDDNTVTPTDSNVLSTTKSLTDNFTPTELEVMLFGKTLGDSISTPSDLTALLTTKYIDDTTTPADSGGSLWLNPYSNPYPVASSYFLNDSGDYTVGESAFTG
jgi:hypothetical protein